MKRKNIVINGKFLMAPLEGMPRVGREITLAFDELIAHQTNSDLSIRILAPKGAKGRIALKNIEVEEVGRSQGLFWEQVEFPHHLGDQYSLNFTATAAVRKRRGCVVVHDAQFFSTRKSHGWKSYVLYGLISKIVSRRYTTIVTVSEYAKREILDYKICDREDIQVIPNGADHVTRRIADNSILEQYELKPGEFMLANSYVHHHKNVRILFEAISQQPALGNRLVLFGSSRRENYESRGIKVPDNVLFVGRITDEQLVGLMKSARMFLFPSLTEGFGLPPLEAMMLGCPTICASAGAMPEICGDGAMFAPPHSAREWRSLIDALWADETQKDLLADAGRLRASSYTWLHSAQKYLDVIRAAITSNGRPFSRDL